MNTKNYQAPPEVICIGQVLMDCIVKGWDPAFCQERVQTADSVTLSPGGDAFNESVILSRLGHHVQTICVLGYDLAGEMLENLLQRNGVNTDKIIKSGQARTPVAPLLVNADGSRKSINASSHLSDFLADFPEASLFKDVRVVSLASLFRAPLTDMNTILTICREAKKAGAIVTADTKLPLINPVKISDMADFLPYIDYIFPNEFEAEFYTEKTDYSEMINVLLDHGVKNVIIKAGAQGCYAGNAHEFFHVPAYPVNAVDSTGAGDNFVAGFLSSLLNGCDFQSSVRFATACSAVSVQSVGAVSGVTDREQVEKLIAEFR